MAQNVADLTTNTENLSIYPRIETVPGAPPNYEEISILDNIRRPSTSIRSSSSSITQAATANLVKLNIGGTIFQTKRTTLSKFDGLLSVMIDTEVPIQNDESGAIFIDRSAKHFDKILNYLRDGHVALPESMEELEEIQKEAKFYLLDGLKDNCDLKMKRISGKKAPFAKEVHVLNSDADLLKVTAEPDKPVLIIYYHVSNKGWVARPEGFLIKPFLDHYQHRLNIYFKSFTSEQNTCNNPTNWSWSLHYRTAYKIVPTASEKLAKGGFKNVDPFQRQLENSVADFLNKTVRV